jgi:hypothetical protein
MCRYTQNIIIAKPSMDVTAKQQCQWRWSYGGGSTIWQQWYNMTAAAVSFDSRWSWWYPAVVVVVQYDSSGVIW